MATELKFSWSMVPIEKLPLGFLQERVRTLADSLSQADMARLRAEIKRREDRGERPSTPEEIAARQAAHEARKQAERDRQQGNLKRG